MSVPFCFTSNMSIKKGETKAGAKPVKKITAAAKNSKVLQEIILHEEWPQTESLIKAEEQRGVLLDPDRELQAKPEFTELIGKNRIQAVGDQTWWQPAVAVFARLSGWLLAPLLIGVTLGKWLDRKYDTAPWLFLATIGVAFLVSMFGLIKNTLEEFKKIEKAANDAKSNIGKNK